MAEGTLSDPIPYAEAKGMVPGPEGLYVDHAVGDEDPTTGLSTLVWWAPGQEVNVPYEVATPAPVGETPVENPPVLY